MSITQAKINTASSINVSIENLKRRRMAFSHDSRTLKIYQLEEFVEILENDPESFSVGFRCFFIRYPLDEYNLTSYSETAVNKKEDIIRSQILHEPVRDISTALGIAKNFIIRRSQDVYVIVKD